MARWLGILFLIQAIATVSCKLQVCTEMEDVVSPCRCCKMRCWFGTYETAKNTLGREPGSAGSEGEAMDTLLAMKECVLKKCSEACLLQKMPILPTSGEVDFKH